MFIKFIFYTFLQIHHRYYYQQNLINSLHNRFSYLQKFVDEKIFHSHRHTPAHTYRHIHKCAQTFLVIASFGCHPKKLTLRVFRHLAPPVHILHIDLNRRLPNPSSSWKNKVYIKTYKYHKNNSSCFLSL